MTVNDAILTNLRVYYIKKNELTLLISWFTFFGHVVCFKIVFYSDIFPLNRSTVFLWCIQCRFIPQADIIKTLTYNISHLIYIYHKVDMIYSEMWPLSNIVSFSNYKNTTIKQIKIPSIWKYILYCI